MRVPELNMKRTFLFLMILFSCMLIGCSHMASDQVQPTPGSAVQTVPDKASPVAEEKDWASSVTLDMSSETLKKFVTVKTFVDGDTTHFIASDSSMVKARYLGINTPEVTGKVEPYGKKASVFTKQRLSQASSIVIESDDSSWNIDSTGSRCLLWVWYRIDEDSPYRNLNIEILQNGLAIASSSANNRYGSACVAAIAQAKALKLNIYSNQKDPDFYYGDAVELSLRELRCNAEKYNGVKVAFEGVVTRNGGNSVYVEDYDEETGLYFGMTVYYGYNLSGEGLNILAVGNSSRIVGTLQYYEAGDTYQVSGLGYRQMKPDDPGNIQKISSGHSGAFKDVSLADLNETVTLEEGEFQYAELAMGTSVHVDSLLVKDVSFGNGSVIIDCESDGYDIVVMAYNMDIGRDLVGHTIDVDAIMGSFGGTYELMVYGKDDLKISE